MKIGLVGLPSSGKSTFFKAATLADVEIANYPFTTINPNVGTAFVKVKCVDREFNKQCNPRTGYCLNGNRFVPVELVDVAGLVEGAHLGKGRGNLFLEDLRQANVLIHIVDISGSTNSLGEPVDVGSQDPSVNIRILEKELDMWYYGILTKGWERFARSTQQDKGDITKALAKQLSAFGVNDEISKKSIESLNLNKDNIMSWTTEDLLKLARDLRLRTKPILVVCNKADLGTGKENYEKVKKEFPSHYMVPCSADYEIALRSAAKAGFIEYVAGEKFFAIKEDKKDKLNEVQKNAFEKIKKVLDSFGSTGVQNALDMAVFDLLGYKAIFPGGTGKMEDSEGRVLPDCFLLPSSATALDFANHIHTDFGKNFVKAIDVRRKIPIGKDHILIHRDVIEIMLKR